MKLRHLWFHSNSPVVYFWLVRLMFKKSKHISKPHTAFFLQLNFFKINDTLLISLNTITLLKYILSTWFSEFHGRNAEDRQETQKHHLECPKNLLPWQQVLYQLPFLTHWKHALNKKYVMDANIKTTALHLWLDIIFLHCSSSKARTFYFWWANK